METRISTRIDADLKKDTEQVLSQLGLTFSELVRLTANQVVMRQGLPFEVKIPNAETIEALNEPRENMKSFDTVDELFADLNAKCDED